MTDPVRGSSSLLDQSAKREAQVVALREALGDMADHDAEQGDNCGDWGTDSCPHRNAARAALRATEPEAGG